VCTAAAVPHKSKNRRGPQLKTAPD
jgi:hypothetical protein